MGCIPEVTAVKLLAWLVLQFENIWSQTGVTASDIHFFSKHLNSNTSFPSKLSG